MLKTSVNERSYEYVAFRDSERCHPFNFNLCYTSDNFRKSARLASMDNPLVDKGAYSEFAQSISTPLVDHDSRAHWRPQA